MLDPARHWYLPGYPLLGALFARVTPTDPFLIPDLGCLVGSLAMFASLGGRLLAGMPHGRAVAGAVFACAALTPKALQVWVVPWTTTPETACILACLLATSNFVERRRLADVFAAALFAVAVAGFRPADAAVVGLASGAALIWAGTHPWPGSRRAMRTVVAAAAGAAFPAGMFGGAYLAVYGWHASGYVILSRHFGFEWRLLPVRWVTMMIDPKPMFPTGNGLAEVFPWIVPGLAGMATALISPRRAGTVWRLHALTIGAVLTDLVLFLSYRDLHQPALFGYSNYHYFKWMLPIFGLYALILLRALVMGPRLRAAAATTVVTFGLAAWRVELTPFATLPFPTTAQRMDLPDGLSDMRWALLTRATGNLALLYQAMSRIEAAGTEYPSFYDYKVFPRLTDEFMALPLRPMPQADGTLLLPEAVSLDLAAAPLLARQTIVWGAPCWFTAMRVKCRVFDPIPAMLTERGRPLQLADAGEATPYLGVGWSIGEQTGRWTEGTIASIAFRLPASPILQPPRFTLVAVGFEPPGGPASRVTIWANGIAVGTWSFPHAAPTTVSFVIPGRVASINGSIDIALEIANSRRPSDYGGDDVRDLGIFVQSIRID